MSDLSDERLEELAEELKKRAALCRSLADEKAAVGWLGSAECWEQSAAAIRQLLAVRAVLREHRAKYGSSVTTGMKPDLEAAAGITP